MNDLSIMKLAAMGMVAALAIANICINHVDGAVTMSAAALIAGIVGYEAGKASKSEVKK